MNYQFEIAVRYDSTAHLWDWRVPNLGAGAAPTPESAFDEAAKLCRKQLEKDQRGRSRDKRN